MSFNIVLQEDLDLLRHLWTDVLQEEACNDGDASEAGQSKCDGPSILLASISQGYISRVGLTSRLVRSSQ